MKDIAVIVPACNESGCLEKNVLALERFLSQNFPSHEIIISEDGSTDGTDGIAAGLASGNQDIIHLHSDRRLGKGRAISNAILHSQSKSIFLMDADLPAGLDSIPRLAGLLGEHELVLGSRLKGKRAERSFSRSLMSVSYNSLVRLAFRTGIRDHQCGVKAFRADSLKEILPEVKASGFTWDTELIVRARRKDLRIREVPIEWQENRPGKSSVSAGKDMARMGMSLARMWLRMNLSAKG